MLDDDELHDPGAVEIPVDWPELHYLQLRLAALIAGREPDDLELRKPGQADFTIRHEIQRRQLAQAEQEAEVSLAASG